uniref:DNA-repair protein XRCC1 n=1 Tax=Erigeron canadensis TaxID=72917 RepID=UPI001CB8FA28|nr:DNA-repair protein XRCC1 [Erigeron canadensis]XP_043616962.1 DNA-repair protein XRCC1 [Erigeron canadensis]
MPDSGSNKAKGRNLPSWMSSRDADNEPDRNKPAGDKDKRNSSQTTTSPESSIGAKRSSKPLEGVVFALSGFVNPERSTLRSQALEMGAEYQADWNANCTLLVCAFQNTPKFRQVEADNGTIVSKGWITECYSQKQLVGIEPYLLNVGKPWKHQSSSTGPSQDPKPNNSYKQVDKAAGSKSRASSSSKPTTHKLAKKEFSTPEVKKWAIDDMKSTISWLNSQDEKPDPGEIKKIAAEGILTCLQDAIDSLKEGKGMEKIIEEWSFVPRVVDELNKLDRDADGPATTSKKDIYHQAIVCKRIYEFELGNFEDDITDKNKRQKIDERGVETKDYDSDDTIEMTEDEVREAFDNVESSIVNDNQLAHR